MNVLMLGLGPEVLTGRAGDVRDRHLAYARRAGHLTMVVSSRRDEGLAPARLSDELDVVPTSSLAKALVPADLYRHGARAARVRRPDLVVTQDPFATGVVGLALARRFRAPLLVGNHSYFFDNEAWMRRAPVRLRAFNRAGKAVVRRADALRVVNVAERDKYVAFGVPPERVHVIPTPVPLDRFLATPPEPEVAALRRRLGLDGKRVLLWVGNPAEPAKDLPTLLRALAVVARERPDAALVAVGDFARAPALVDEARRLGVAANLFLPGQVPHRELPAYYALAEVYVHSSRFEGLAKVWVEAAASARPVVSTRAPGVEAAVEEGVTGLLAEVGDAEGLAERVLELLADPARAAKMGEAARLRARERHDHDRAVDAVVDLWRAVAQGGR